MTTALLLLGVAYAAFVWGHSVGLRGGGRSSAAVPTALAGDEAVFSSEAAVREYVQSQLTQLVAKHSELKVTPGPVATEPHNPAWLIWGEEVTGESKQFYRIDVDLARAEFVVWFGHQCGTKMPEAHFRPAVHFDLRAYDELLEPVAYSEETRQALAKLAADRCPFSLGELLDWMLLQDEKIPRYTRQRRYPMNYVRY
jgi:hypothetical protein